MNWKEFGLYLLLVIVAVVIAQVIQSMLLQQTITTNADGTETVTTSFRKKEASA